MKTEHLTEDQLKVIGARLAVIFKLKRSADHPKDRWDIEGGDKTNLGLANTFIGIAEQIEQGRVPWDHLPLT